MLNNFNNFQHYLPVLFNKVSILLSLITGVKFK